MNGESKPASRRLPLEVLDLIDQICDRFETAWETGERPRLEQYLSEVAEPYRRFLARDLLAAEIEARRRRGEHPTIADYKLAGSAPTLLEFDLPPAAELLRMLDVEADSNVCTRDDSRPGAEECPRKLGDCRIDRELGRGGMGIVYRAFDEKRGMVVALKTLRRADSVAICRFKREFRALADMYHPNLVPLYELSADGGIWFFTMELVDGVNFLAFVERGVAWPAIPEPVEQDAVAARPRGFCASPAAMNRLRATLKQLAEGVACLHGAGKLHRDLKPSNVLVNRQGRVVILDFGLAVELGPSGLHQSSVPQVLGTVAYVAPEQAAGHAVSPACDWYSLGSMLYEALTGRPPFVGRPLQVLMDKQQFEPSAPCGLVSGLPDDLNSLCVDLLRRDPEARPNGCDILRRLGRIAGEPHPPVLFQPSPQRSLKLIGRARHLERLEAAFEAMCRNATAILYIHGPSGIGKSALARWFLDERVGRDEAIVLSGRCHEQESVPYKAIDGVIDALAQYLKRLPFLEAQSLLPRDILSLVRVFPTLREAEAVATAPRLAAEVVDPQEIRRRAFRALRELLARMGDRRPLIVAIDDLQWGDSDSATLLAELLRPPDPPRLMLLGCYRSEDADRSPLLQRMLNDAAGFGADVQFQLLALGSLEPAEAQNLAIQLLAREDQASHAQSIAIARESAGNPFFVAEMVRHVQANFGVLDFEPPSQELALDEVLCARTRLLPAEARRLLELIAVAGQPLGQVDASQAAELGAEAGRAFAVLRSWRFIRSAGSAESDEVETYHDRVREAVVSRLSPADRATYHRRLALVLEASGRTDPEVLAVHFQQGARDLPRAGTYFAQAAEQAAAAMAFDRAAKLYRLALEARSSDDQEARRLRVGIGDALANSGRAVEAAREYLAAAAGATVAQAFDLRRRAAMQYLISGHLDEGLAELSALLTAIGISPPSTLGRAILSLIWQRFRLRMRGLKFRPCDPSQVSAEVLSRIDVCWAAAGGLGFIDPIRGADFSTRHLLMALKAGEPHRIALGLCLEASHIAYNGRPGERRAFKLLKIAQDIADRVNEPHTQGRVVLGLGTAIYMGGNWKRAAELCDRAGAILRTHCSGSTWEVDTSSLFSLWSLQFQGEIDELGRRWPIALKEARERGNRHVATILDTFLMSTLRLAANDPEGAGSQLRQVMNQWTQHGFHIQHNEWFGAEVQVRLYRGDGLKAWEFVTSRYGPALAHSYLMRVQKIKVFFYERRARCALAAAAETASPAWLLCAAERDARRLEGMGTRWSQALAYPIRAGVAAARRDRTRAAGLFAAAVDHLEAVDMKLHAAASRRRLGELLGGQTGREQIERADSWMGQQAIQDPVRMTDVFAPAAS